MQTKNGFALMTAAEFPAWLAGQRVARDVQLVQQHHTWSPAYAQFTGSNHFAQQQGMKNYHVSIGYSDIAQHFTTFPDGMICTGRSLASAPAGIVGANANGICIENLGNFDRGHDTMTKAQRDTIVRMTAALLRHFELTAARGVTYHGWWTENGTSLGDYVAGRSCKTCPGTAFFGGNTRASYDKHLRPLLEAAMAGTYEEDETMTYEQFKAYQERYAKEQEAKSPNAWAQAAWDKATEVGITDGTAPQAPMTREQGVVMMQRAGVLGE